MSKLAVISVLLYLRPLNFAQFFTRVLVFKYASKGKKVGSDGSGDEDRGFTDLFEKKISNFSRFSLLTIEDV